MVPPDLSLGLDVPPDFVAGFGAGRTRNGKSESDLISSVISELEVTQQVVDGLPY